MTTYYAIWTEKKAALELALRAVDAERPCCKHCEHYTAKGCAVYGSQPPAEWVDGPVDCADFLLDSIPF